MLRHEPVAPRTPAEIDLISAEISPMNLPTTTPPRVLVNIHAALVVVNPLGSLVS